MKSLPSPGILPHAGHFLESYMVDCRAELELVPTPTWSSSRHLPGDGRVGWDSGVSEGSLPRLQWPTWGQLLLPHMRGTKPTGHFPEQRALFDTKGGVGTGSLSQ